MPDNAPVTAAELDERIEELEGWVKLNVYDGKEPFELIAYRELRELRNRLAAIDAAAQGDAVAGVMEIAAELQDEAYYRRAGTFEIKSKLRDAIAALVARADAEAERAERAEEAVVALLNRVLIYHDSEIDAGFFQCVDCCRTVSVRNVSFGSCGEEIEHSISCDVADTLREHAATIAAARGRVQKSADAIAAARGRVQKSADAIAAARGRVREVRE